MSRGRLSEYERGSRVIDRQAAARAGCSTPDVLYEDPRDDVWPLPVDEPEMVYGRCECGSLLHDDGCGMASCSWCGHRRRIG